LKEHGTAVWDSPLDPHLLLSALGGHGLEPPPALGHSGDGGALEASPDAWLVVQPRTREVAWANATARAGLVLPGTARLSERGLDAVPPAVFERERGCEPRSHQGRPHVLVWWTDERDRRCVGLVRATGTPAPAGEENARTLAELGRLSATLAHELRNPLASFAGALDLLEREEAAAERAEILVLAKGRLRQMKTMLDDTLRFARPFRSPPEAVSARDAVASAVAAARGDPALGKVEFRVEVGARVPDVLAHAEPLRQALVNLILNAAQAQGGTGTVSVSVEAAGTGAWIRVRDEGPGVPRELRDQLFTPFRTTKPGGTGLGLAFVRRVAEAAGGRALVEDSPKGACFRLELPLAPHA
jgi:signal transduction histidine kinase